MSERPKSSTGLIAAAVIALIAAILIILGLPLVLCGLHLVVSFVRIMGAALGLGY